MNSFKTAVISAAAILVGFAANAAPVTYDVSSYIQGGSPEHTLWWSNNNPAGPNPPGSSGDKQNHFLVEQNGGSGTMTINDDGTASFMATVYNQANEGFIVDLSLQEYIPNPPTDPYPGVKGKSQIFAQNNNWRFFDLVSGSLEGLNGLSNYDVELDDGGNGYKFQFGFGANDKYNSFGASSWLKLTDSSCDENCTVYYGDINVDLALVPLPPSLALMLAGLGGIGLMARRRRKS